MASDQALNGDGKVLLVAGTGGHLEELHRLAARFDIATSRRLWVTHDDAQSRSLLAGERVRYIPYVPPRGYRQLVRVMPEAVCTMRREQVSAVVSTGAGVALPYLVAARGRRLAAHFIESAARADGPSLTGRLASRIPGVRLYTQHRRWATDTWRFQGSLFDGFAVAENPPPKIKRVVITLGSMRTYGFRRLVDRLLVVLPRVLEPGADVLWQVGATDARDIPGRVTSSLPAMDLRAAMAEADLVVAHSGIGSALTALDVGKRPLLVPRRVEFDEHVDSHQELIGVDLDARALAVMAEADRVTEEDLLRAASASVTMATGRSSFHLV